MNLLFEKVFFVYIVFVRRDRLLERKMMCCSWRIANRMNKKLLKERAWIGPMSVQDNVFNRNYEIFGNLNGIG